MAQKQRLFKLKGMKFEIAELEMQVSGEDAEQQIRSVLSDEFNRILAPVTQALRPQLEAPPPPADPVAAALPVEAEKRSTRRGSRQRAATGAGPGPAPATALDWKPDTRKYGTPTVAWSTYDKASWMLYCYAKDNAGKENGAKGLSLPVIVATFNKHFPDSRGILYDNLKRDFRRNAKTNRVTSVRDQTPAIWYLTDVGTAEVEARIKQFSGTLPLHGVSPAA